MVAVAHDAILGGPCVVKAVFGRDLTSGRPARLADEYRHLADIEASGFVRARGFGVDAATDVTWLAMDCAPGKTLNELGILGVDTAMHVADQVLRALAELHDRGLAHLDVKPRNIVLDTATGRVTLLDLDLATDVAGGGRGTATYAAPEAFLGRGGPDRRSDFWSLAATLVELLTGDLRDESTVVDDERFGRLAPFVRASLQRDSRNRPTDAYAALRLLGGDPMISPRVRPPWVRRGLLLERVLRSFPRIRGESLHHAVPVVAIRGPMGSGKSRLLSKVAATLTASGCRVLDVGAKGVIDKWGTLGAIRRLLTSLSVVDESRTEGASWIDRASCRDRAGVFDRMADSVLRAARRRRTVFVVDDMDLLDETSREFLGHFFRQLGEDGDGGHHGVLVQVLVAYDPSNLVDDRVRQWIEGEASLGAATVIPILPMSDAESSQLARLTAPIFVDPAAMDTLVAESGGNPKAIVEGLRLISRGAPLADALGCNGRLDARVASIPVPARQVLAVLAHAVASVSTGVLLAAAGDSAKSALALLEQLGEVHHADQGWSLVDIGLARHLSNPRDASIDIALATSLGDADGVQHAIVVHRLFGGLMEGTFDLALTQVGRLRAAGNEVELALLLETLLLKARVSPFVTRCSALWLFDLRLSRGRTSSARQVLVHAVGSDTSGDAQLAIRLARASMREGDQASACRSIEAVLSTSPYLSESERAELSIELAELLLAAGRPADSRAVLGSARGWADTAIPSRVFVGGPSDTRRLARLDVAQDERTRAARYLILLGELERVAGRPAFAISCHRAAADLASAEGNVALLGRAAHCEGSAYLAAGDLALAESAFRRAIPLRKEQCDLLGLADTANNLGVVLRRLARGSEAIEQFSVSMRLRRQAGHVAGEGSSFLSLANVHFERRELDAAKRHYGRALSLFIRIGDQRGQAMVLNNLGAVAHLQGSHDEAARHYADAERLDRQVGDIAGALVRRINLADLWITMACFGQAWRAVELVERVEASRGSRQLSSRCALLRARLWLLTGDARQAEAEATVGQKKGVVEDACDFKLVIAESWLVLGRSGAAYDLARSVISEMPPVETRAIAAEILGLAAVAVGALACREAIPELVEAARAAERHGLPWARFRASRGLGASFRKAGEPHRARAAYHDAFEALERVAHGLTSRESLERWLAHPAVQEFGREVADLGQEVKTSRPRIEDVAVTDFLRGLKDALFDAERHGAPASRYRGDGLRGVLEVAKKLSNASSDADLHVNICEGLVELFKAERSFLVLVDEKGRTRVTMARTMLREPIDDPESEISRHIVEETIKGRVGMRFDNAMRDGTLHVAASVANLELRSVMAAPMLKNGQPIGLLYVDHRLVSGHFSDTDLEILEALAAQVAVALDRGRLEQERRRNEALKLVGDLAGGVAHDFNNLLAAILGRAQEIQLRHPDSPILPAIKTIEKAARDGALVVQRLQDFARTRRDVPFSSVPIRDLLADVVEFTRSRWETDALRMGIRIEVSMTADLELSVMGCASELREVFTNIALNAIKAMPAGGSLNFAAEARDSHVLVTVGDTGIGMTEDVREHLFDPYFTTSSDGSGLGMGIVFGIVSRHHGSISVESRIGQGTRVQVVFPQSVSVKSRVEEGPSIVHSMNGVRGMVVDDEPSVRAVICDVLSDVGVHIDAYENGAEAIANLEAGELDFVLTDLGMVPVNGFELAAAIRKVDMCVAIVLVTGWGAELDRDEAPGRDIDLILNKPFEMARLIEITAQAARLTEERRRTQKGLT